MMSSKVPSMVRSFSASSASTQMVKPPVQVFGLEGRYATALYSAASKKKELEAVEKDLTKFQASIKTDARLKEFILNPTIKRNAKVEAFKHLTSKINLSPATGNLFTIMAENGRLNKLEAVINAFKVMMAAHRGEVICEVVTAKPLDATQQKSLEGALKKFLKPSETLLLTAKVDPALIGGMKVSIGDKYVDMSVASKVKKYTEIISAAV